MALMCVEKQQAIQLGIFTQKHCLYVNYEFLCERAGIRWDYTHSSSDFSLREVCSESLWSRERQKSAFQEPVWWNPIPMKERCGRKNHTAPSANRCPRFTACKCIRTRFSHQRFRQQLCAMLGGELQRFGLLPTALAESEVEFGALAFPRRRDATDIAVRPLNMPET